MGNISRPCLKVKEKGWGTPDCFPEYFPDFCDADLFVSDFRSLFSFQYIYYLFLIFLSNILNLYSNWRFGMSGLLFTHTMLPEDLNTDY